MLNLLIGLISGKDGLGIDYTNDCRRRVGRGHRGGVRGGQLGAAGNSKMIDGI